MSTVFSLTVPQPEMEDGTTIGTRKNTIRADKLIFDLCQSHDELHYLSRSQIQKLIEAGKIKSKGIPIRSKDSLTALAQIEIELEAPSVLEMVPENIPLQLLFEDEHLVVINKQPGLTVHPSETQHQGTLVNALLFHIKDLSGIGGVLRPGIVHRIDKNTSGAIVVTKTDLAHAGLSTQFANHSIQRKYWALVYGAPKFEGTYRLETKLGRNPTDRVKMAVTTEEGRNAVTLFSVRCAYGVPQKNPFAAWIEATLETGRTHQVRVHLNHLGHSILGDPLYGVPSANQPKWRALPHAVQDKVIALPGQALHARVLGFKHPITEQELYFEADPFPQFQALLNELNSRKN